MFEFGLWLKLVLALGFSDCVSNVFIVRVRLRLRFQLLLMVWLGLTLS